MVRVHPDPPSRGAIAQLGEHRLCKPGVGGSNPPGSTTRHLLGFHPVKAIDPIPQGIRNGASVARVACGIGLTPTAGAAFQLAPALLFNNVEGAIHR